MCEDVTKKWKIVNERSRDQKLLVKREGLLEQSDFAVNSASYLNDCKTDAKDEENE